MFIALAAVGIALATTASAGTTLTAISSPTLDPPPVAPYTVFTMDGGEFGGDDVVLTQPSTNIYVQGYGSAETGFGFGFNAYNAAANQYWNLVIAPADGTSLTTGTFATGDVSQGALVRFNIGGNGTGCSNQTGTLVITEVTWDDVANLPSAFAATYTSSCDSWTGEIRWHSSQGYRAGQRSSRFLGFNTVSRGTTTPSRLLRSPASAPIR